MSLLESQSKGCVNPTFDPAHKCIFAMYLQGHICTVGTRASAHPMFLVLCTCTPPISDTPVNFVPTQYLVPRYSTDL